MKKMINTQFNENDLLLIIVLQKIEKPQKMVKIFYEIRKMNK